MVKMNKVININEGKTRLYFDESDCPMEVLNVSIAPDVGFT